MYRSDVVGDLGTALLVGGWSTRMTLIGEHCGLVTGLAVEDLVRQERWLLIEENRRDGRLRLFDAVSPAQAMERPTGCLPRGMDTSLGWWTSTPARWSW